MVNCTWVPVCVCVRHTSSCLSYAPPPAGLGKSLHAIAAGQHVTECVNITANSFTPVSPLHEGFFEDLAGRCESLETTSSKTRHFRGLCMYKYVRYDMGEG